MSFRLFIEPEAVKDIQEGIYWYNSQKNRLGHRFYSDVLASLNQLKKYPFFQKRYDDVRCVPLKKFPFLIHFTVDEQEKLISIRAVFNTARNQESLKKRTEK